MIKESGEALRLRRSAIRKVRHAIAKALKAEPRPSLGQRPEDRAQGHDKRPATYDGAAPCCALTMRPKSFSNPAWRAVAVLTTAPHAACL